MSQTAKQLPIKEFDTSLNRLEKENFDLKLQISHLRSKLNELTNSSLTFIPTCDCKRTKTETKDVLSEVKVEMKNLLDQNEIMKAQNTDLLEKLEDIQRENESLRKDCVKLSQHISEQTKREAESKNVLHEMKAEIETVKEEMEEVEKIKQQNKMLKEEYMSLDRIAKKLETEYKEEYSQFTSENASLQKVNSEMRERIKKMESQLEEQAQRNAQLASENHALCIERSELQQNTRTLESLRQNIQNQLHVKTDEALKTKEIGEKLVNELKSKSKHALLQKEEVERRAEGIIKNRDMTIHQLKDLIERSTTEMQNVNIKVSAIQSEMGHYIKYLVSLIHRIAKFSGEMDRAKMLSASTFGQYKSRVIHIQNEQSHRQDLKSQREKETMQDVVLDAKREIERIQAEKDKLLAEREDLIGRLHITPNTLKIAKDLGINEFTTIDNLFITWKTSQDQIVEGITRKHKAEGMERSRKLEEFQTKLQAALSELNLCRAYLEEKKNIIKSIRKAQGPSSLLNRIDVSNK
ncbi:hypothetical protein NEAUS04_0534 [Nematocida ausubeli]|uniref:Centrosomin N-terminal motif 1 domain-containing protein n=2 Tax=Nematocida ausubeli (strain ATCC PRA-371 / ERTm2) TaxID=1913371 RepID=A0A086J049_NEMA1|nr:uncharacterized protein NESG_02293 [Nematocida ausubeli]KAI5133884.1 hypothetical protein NEAUS07_0621 [Nematocida ausubeli]KAI5161460.1 hypothetical protein NEAUS04_0534 [Nematocida ausubeli]KFG25517.1 hypothetical protein NESG_02293 [Nematocida ausubeli]